MDSNHLSLTAHYMFSKASVSEVWLSPWLLVAVGEEHRWYRYTSRRRLVPQETINVVTRPTSTHAANRGTNTSLYTAEFPFYVLLSFSLRYETICSWTHWSHVSESYTLWGFEWMHKLSTSNGKYSYPRLWIVLCIFWHRKLNNVLGNPSHLCCIICKKSEWIFQWTSRKEDS